MNSNAELWNPSLLWALFHAVFLSLNRKCNPAIAPGYKASNVVTIVFLLQHPPTSLYLSILSCPVSLVSLRLMSSCTIKGNTDFF